MDGACAGCVRVGGGWRGVGVDGYKDGSGVADISISILCGLWTLLRAKLQFAKNTGKRENTGKYADMQNPTY